MQAGDLRGTLPNLPLAVHRNSVKGPSVPSSDWRLDRVVRDHWIRERAAVSIQRAWCIRRKRALWQRCVRAQESCKRVDRLYELAVHDVDSLATLQRSAAIPYRWVFPSGIGSRDPTGFLPPGPASPEDAEQQGLSFEVVRFLRRHGADLSSRLEAAEEHADSALSRVGAAYRHLYNATEQWWRFFAQSKRLRDWAHAPGVLERTVVEHHKQLRLECDAVPGAVVRIRERTPWYKERVRLGHRPRRGLQVAERAPIAVDVDGTRWKRWVHSHYVSAKYYVLTRRRLPASKGLIRIRRYKPCLLYTSDAADE